MTDSTMVMPIHRPAARAKIDHALAIQLQPWPIGTSLPLSTKVPRSTMVSSGPAGCGAACGLALM